MDNKGFTLIETVVSLAVLGVLMMLVTGIFASASSKTAASLAAGGERERLMASFEEAAATGRVSPGLERLDGAITIDFGGKIINTKGRFLSGIYGDNRIIIRYFLADEGS